MSVKVGDRLFKVTHTGFHRREPRTSWVVVTKVGRKWAEYADEEYPNSRGMSGRFDKETLKGDTDGNFSVRFYHSEEAWHERKRLTALWAEFQRKVSKLYRAPEGVDDVAVLKAADALGIRLESE